MPYLKTLLIAIALYILALWLPVFWLWKVVVVALLYVFLFYLLFYKQYLKKELSTTPNGL
jgi:membrane protein implicated in regulation of membrane protease activity